MKAILQKNLKKLASFVEIDAGWNNVSLFAFEKQKEGRILELTDGQIVELIQSMAKEILRLRKEVKRLS